MGEIIDFKDIAKEYNFSYPKLKHDSQESKVINFEDIQKKFEGYDELAHTILKEEYKIKPKHVTLLRKAMNLLNTNEKKVIEEAYEINKHNIPKYISKEDYYFSGIGKIETFLEQTWEKYLSNPNEAEKEFDVSSAYL